MRRPTIQKTYAIVEYLRLLHRYQDPTAQPVRAWWVKHQSDPVFVERAKKADALILTKQALRGEDLSHVPLAILEKMPIVAYGQAVYLYGLDSPPAKELREQHAHDPDFTRQARLIDEQLSGLNAGEALE